VTAAGMVAAGSAQEVVSATSATNGTIRAQRMITDLAR
jgi:hypothetical protein